MGGFLEGLARLEAARRGISPSTFDFAQAQQFQDPAYQAYLLNNPQRAQALGIPTQPFPGISVDPAAGGVGPPGPAPAQLGVNAGQPLDPGTPIPMLPGAVNTLQSLQRGQIGAATQGQLLQNQWQQFLQNAFGMGGGQGGQALPVGNGGMEPRPLQMPASTAPPNVPPVPTDPTTYAQPRRIGQTPAAGPMTLGGGLGGGNMVVKGIGPGGPSLGFRQPVQVEAGTIGPDGQPITGPTPYGGSLLLPKPQPGQLVQAQMAHSMLDLVNESEHMLKDPRFRGAVAKMGPAGGSSLLAYLGVPNAASVQYQGGGGPLLPGFSALSQQDMELANKLGVLRGLAVTGLAGTGTGRLKSVIQEFMHHVPDYAKDTPQQTAEKLKTLRTRYGRQLARIPSNASVTGGQMTDPQTGQPIDLESIFGEQAGAAPPTAPEGPGTSFDAAAQALLSAHQQKGRIGRTSPAGG